MSYNTLTYQKEDYVAVINIVGPVEKQEKMAELAHELSDLCEEITMDKEIRVIILTGGEKAFCVGPHKAPLTGFFAIAEPIGMLDLPVIAATSGDVIGQGLELALACDIRIATETTHFELPHIKEGLIPWDGGTQRLSRLVGKARTMEMILTGKVIDAQEAYRIGLVNRIVPCAELTAVVSEMARQMASKGQIALRYAKEAINKGMDLTLGQGLRLEADLYCLLHTTRDRTEGIKAFQEKRTARFETE